MLKRAGTSAESLAVSCTCCFGTGTDEPTSHSRHVLTDGTSRTARAAWCSSPPLRRSRLGRVVAAKCTWCGSRSALPARQPASREARQSLQRSTRVRRAQRDRLHPETSSTDRRDSLDGPSSSSAISASARGPVEVSRRSPPHERRSVVAEELERARSPAPGSPSHGPAGAIDRYRTLTIGA